MEPQVIEQEEGGAYGMVLTFQKGPVSVTIHQDPEAENPTAWGEPTEAEVAAYESGEVFTLWISYHDDEADAAGPIYGMDEARREALEGLEHAWKRYQDEK